MATPLSILYHRHPRHTTDTGPQRKGEPYSSKRGRAELHRGQQGRAHSTVYPSCVRASSQSAFRDASLFPEGYILVLSWVEGQPLSLHWRSPEAISRVIPRITTSVNSARRRLACWQQLGIYLLDSGPHNVLFDEGSGRVTIIDCKKSLDAPELVTIFERNN